MPVKIEELPSSRKLVLGRDCGYFPVVSTMGGEHILIVYRAGAGHMGINGRLEAIISHDDGLCWTDPIVVADSPLDDRNPSIGVTKDGIVVVAYHVNGNYVGDERCDPTMNRLYTYLARSHDGGRTWEEPYELNVRDFRGYSPYGQMLTLQNGSLLMPIYGPCRHEEGKVEVVRTHILCSENSGVTWQHYATLAENENESSILMLPNGEMMAAMRSEKDSHLSTSFSHNEGRTWQFHQDITHEYEHPACLTLLSGGEVLLSYGRRANPFGARALLSTDAGRTWITQKEMIFGDDCPNADCGYPSTVLLDSGRLATTYYSTSQLDGWSCMGARLNFITYDEEKLLQALAEPTKRE